MRVTLRQLEALVQVAQLGSVTAAGERMGLTQPAVSSLLRELERAFGKTTLLDRTGRTVRLTEAGRKILTRAKLILAETTTLVEELRGFQIGNSGTVSITATAAVSSAVLPATLQAFGEYYPQWRYVIHDVLPQNLVETVLDGTADLGIGTVGPHPELEQTLLSSDVLSLVTAAGSPLAQNREIRWIDLSSLPTIVMRKANTVRAILDGALVSHGLRLEPFIEVNLLETALALAAEGLGHAILPPFLIPAVRRDQLTVLPLVEPRVPRQLSVFTKRGRVLPSAAEQFRQMSVARISAIGGHP